MNTHKDATRILWNGSIMLTNMIPSLIRVHSCRFVPIGVSRIVCGFVLLSCCAFSFAEFPTTRPYPGVTYVHEMHDDPPQSVYVVTLDLADPNVSVRVAPGGADPDGDGQWQTTLMTVRDIAQREHFDIAVNASFFAVTRPGGAGEIAEEKAE